MKIIITGATGSLGAYLTRWFSEKGHEVIAVGRIKNPPARLVACSTYFQADITSPFILPEADVCIHTAAIADDKAKATDLYLTNVTGTENVALAAKHCKTFVHISSSSVYMNSDKLLKEEMAGEKPGEKLSAYGKSKLLAEESLINFYKNDSCFILRPRGIYGAGDKVLLPRMLKLVKKNKMIRAGSMNVHLSMTHFSNFAIAIERCVHSQKNGIHIYNVADDGTYVLYDVVKKLLSELYSCELPEKKLPLWVLKCMSALKIGEATPLFINTVSKSLSLDISKIKHELNYTPLMKFEDSLKEIGEWVKSVGGIEVIKSAHPGLAWEISN
jgi:nucleoside-diphosphate-sugar epimerase